MICVTPGPTRWPCVPLGRFAEVEEFAAAVVFLAGDDASVTTVRGFLVDCGVAGADVTSL